MKSKGVWLLLIPSFMLLLLGMVLWQGAVIMPKASGVGSLFSFSIRELITWSLAGFLLLLQCVRWGLFLTFGIWLNRRTPLRSLPWLIAHWLLMIPITLGMPFLFGRIFTAKAVPFGWTAGTFMVQWNMWSRFFGGTIGVLTALMILSDLAFVLSRSGIELDKEWLHGLLKFRDYSTSLGIAIILLTLTMPIVLIVVWII